MANMPIHSLDARSRSVLPISYLPNSSQEGALHICQQYWQSSICFYFYFMDSLDTASFVVSGNCHRLKVSATKGHAYLALKQY